MSNGARFDSLLVRHLAEELDRLLRGRTLRLRPLSGAGHSVRLDGAPGGTLHLDLHPATRGVRLEPAEAAPAGGARLRVEGVAAPPDERVLRFDLLGGNRFREEQRVLVVELIPARENACELDGEGRIVQLLRPLRDPSRELFPGAPYAPPAPTARLLPRGEGEEERRRLAAAWEERLGALPPGERRAAYLAGFAFAGPLSAGWILGGAARDDAPPGALEEAFSRWWELAHATSRPVLLPVGGGVQPYPHPLGEAGAVPLPSLLEGFARAPTAGAPQRPGAALPDAGRVARAEKRLAAARRRLEHLEAERERSAGGAALRERADLLLAHLHLVERGAARARLPDWEGGEAEVELDPERSPAENAERLYAEARKLDRARERLPALVAAAGEEIARRERELEAARAGEVPPGGESRSGAGARGGSRAAAREEESLPYRRYRTSGGLEVRVGRSSRANDRLTFGHSDPKDVWMHARAVSGSHVILRWSRDEPPPARDLEEAAVLAALHSRARGSGVVAVDWTQRRQVRKPRGAPPGAVTPGRTRTVFVEPDAGVEERMRWAEG